MSDESSDNYLWDGSGEPDEQLAALEALLARYRFDRLLPPGSDDDVGEPGVEPIP